MSQYKARGPLLRLQCARMERLRPITKHEKRMWDLRHKPWAYEYKVDPAPLPAMKVHKEAGIGVALLALLASIIDVPFVLGEEKTLAVEGRE